MLWWRVIDCLLLVCIFYNGFQAASVFPYCRVMEIIAFLNYNDTEFHFSGDYTSGSPVRKSAFYQSYFRVGRGLMLSLSRNRKTGNECGAEKVGLKESFLICGNKGSIVPTISLGWIYKGCSIHIPQRNVELIKHFY